VYEIDNDLLDRMGPRNVAGLEILGGILHPEAFR
jgi:ABC-type Fe3+-hydroxamate transport system substrate-binding protein